MEESAIISMEIGKTVRGIKRFFESKKNFENFNEATQNQCHIIGFLYENREKEIYQKDIEKEFDIRRSTATNMLKLMEKNGYIERFRVKNDERLKRIALTPQAKQVGQKIGSRMESLNRQIEQGITPEEKRIFFEVLEKINNNVKVGDEIV